MPSPSASPADMASSRREPRSDQPISPIAAQI
jgi:hypothetical protein